ncbi:hypothetical protein CYLTODRAFT_426758 [Cylindrobasidium torrendii FP15055 ss-10]|uniref:F-box domain-containing protein n=1 Tax=Cylindrobasidium torrendii FP15055 ss-10 TaxID=1314674 RepID=A0A0D7AXN4_9AGAR|nr:hypothetical protein CYLTODRAFT_426758 [Cylindrobasidium torrendii FP15055 ss-10]
MEIVIQNRLLWSSIALFGTDGQQMDRLLRVLHLSGEAPLDILIAVCDLEPLKGILSPHSRRFRTFSVGYAKWDWTAMQRSIPALEYVDLTGFTPPATHYESISAAFTSAPALRRITCSPKLVLHIMFPWSQIVELRIRREALNLFDKSEIIRTPKDRKRLFDIISAAPLRLLTCTDDTGSEFPAMIKPDIEVAQIPPSWLPRFTLPSLRKYSICWYRDLAIKDILDLFHRSGCTLTHLDISDFNGGTNKGALEDLLLALPQLKELDLHISSDRSECVSHWELIWLLFMNKDLLPDLRSMRLRSKGSEFDALSIGSWLRTLVFDGATGVVNAGHRKLRLLALDFREGAWQGPRRTLAEEEARERLLKSAEAAHINLYVYE